MTLILWCWRIVETAITVALGLVIAAVLFPVVLLELALASWRRRRTHG